MGLFDGLFGGGSGLFGGGGLFGGSSTFGGSGWSSGGSSFVGPNPIEKQTTDIATQLVKDYIKKNDDGVIGDIVRLSDDTKEEFTELMTVGFTEMVIKGNKNYKTSFEIRDEADEIIYKQVERYKAKCSEINESIEKLDLHIRKLHKTKIDLSNELNLIINKASTINQKVKYNSWAEPGYQNAKDGISIILGCVGLGNASTVYNNIKNANEYMNEAKDYDIYVSKKIAEMNRASAYIESVEAHLVEEEQILKALHDSIRFNRNLQYKEIAVQLHRMISEYVMSENSQINSAYLDAINKIKQCIGCS